MKNIVLVGRGAVGSVYAVQLSSTPGIRFRVALDAARKERYEREPFFFNAVQYKFDYFVPSSNEQNVDLIIIATKWGGYADALDLIEPLVGTDTIILPLLNGLSAYRVAVERFGEQRVMRGFYIGHTASRLDNNGVSQDGTYKTNFGEQTNIEPYSERVNKVKTLFDKADIKYRIPANMLTAQWQKFVMNIGTNQPTGLYHYSYGELRASTEAMELSRALMGEAQAIAVHLGVPRAEELTDNALQVFDTLYSGDYSSMAQDTRSGRETEVDIFAGEVIKMGRELSIPTPRNEEFYKQLVGRAYSG